MRDKFQERNVSYLLNRKASLSMVYSAQHHLISTLLRKFHQKAVKSISETLAVSDDSTEGIILNPCLHTSMFLEWNLTVWNYRIISFYCQWSYCNYMYISKLLYFQLKHIQYLSRAEVREKKIVKWKTKTKHFYITPSSMLLWHAK